MVNLHCPRRMVWLSNNKFSQLAELMLNCPVKTRLEFFLSHRRKLLTLFFKKTTFPDIFRKSSMSANETLTYYKRNIFSCINRNNSCSNLIAKEQQFYLIFYLVGNDFFKIWVIYFQFYFTCIRLFVFYLKVHFFHLRFYFKILHFLIYTKCDIFFFICKIFSLLIMI